MKLEVAQGLMNQIEEIAENVDFEDKQSLYEHMGDVLSLVRSEDWIEVTKGTKS